VEEKCQIVRETLVAGRSVAEVARAHEVNANQVFDWRKQYLEGRLDPKREDGLMLPVVLSEPDEEKEKASAPVADAHICGRLASAVCTKRSAH
jgi:transposase